MHLVQQAQNVENYIESLEYENIRLRNALFRLLEKGSIGVTKKEYFIPEYLDFEYNTEGQDLIIKQIDFSKIGVKSSQQKIDSLKLKII
jgi:hypothetical protein